MHGRNLVALPGNQADTEKTNLDLPHLGGTGLLDRSGYVLNPVGEDASYSVKEGDILFCLVDGEEQALCLIHSEQDDISPLQEETVEGIAAPASDRPMAEKTSSGRNDGAKPVQEGS